MPNSLTIDIQGLSEFKGKIASLGKKITDGIDAELDAFAKNIVAKAKDNLARGYPQGAYDNGGLANSIDYIKEYLVKTITVNAFYAPFIEFGTGAYAAAYVSSLPANWAEFAAKFKVENKEKGTLDEFLLKMVEWVKRKGIHGTTKSGRSKTGIKADADAYNIAYVIVISILRHGIHPHPFLYPAFVQEQPDLIKNIENVLKNIK